MVEGNSLVSSEGAKQILQLRGLPPVQMLVGAKFIFGDEEHFISGSIVAVGYSAKEGVKLYVTSPRYRGKPLRCLKEVSGGWAAVPAEGDPVSGTFHLF